jgi:hypothetical protein
MRAPREDFDIRTKFMKERSGFKRTLAAANDDHTLIREP